MNKQMFYAGLADELATLLTDERDWIANAANTAALLYLRMADVNWAGFYFRQGAELVLGPFQGKPACVRIAIGRGVCGTAARRRETIVVPDVHLFPGHIACDSASNSEVVVPILIDGCVVGVLDIDSPLRGRFDADDGKGLERIVAVFCAATDLNTGSTEGA
ncbi:MAG: GAF domain-containing protein [Pirellulaceae bacterium]|nr:GAF domain-containing protein [Pirellulaceae bacterium]